MEKRTRSSLSTLTAISTFAMLTEIPEWLYFITNKSTHLRHNNVFHIPTRSHFVRESVRVDVAF